MVRDISHTRPKTPRAREPRNVAVDATADQLVRNNPDRVAIIFQNVGTVDAHIDITNQVTTTNGLTLLAGAIKNFLVSEDAAMVILEWFGIVGAGSTTIRVWEMTKN